MTTASEARNKVLNKALSQLGTRYTTTWSKYGSWYGGDATDNFLWCAIFQSWAFQQALGYSDALKLIGNEAASGYSGVAGHAWTVSMLTTMENMGCKKVSVYDAQPGDIAFTKWPNASGGRSTNRCNHVDMVVKPAAYNYIQVVGGNTPKPGSYGDPSAGRGVWLHSRSCYSTPWAGIMRPQWSKVATSEPDKPVTRSMNAPSTGTVSTYAKIVQRVVGRPVTSAFLPGDVTAVKDLQRKLGVTVDGRFGKKTAEAYLLSFIKRSGNLNKGDRGNAVRLWQYAAMIPGKEIDGSFGTDTEAATKRMQAALGLTRDGVVGPNTISKAL